MKTLRQKRTPLRCSWAVFCLAALFGLPGTNAGSTRVDASPDGAIQKLDINREGTVNSPGDPIQPSVCDVYIQGTPKGAKPWIVAEQPGGVAERIYFHYDKPDVALRSYAALNLLTATGGAYCSGTMIGPNMMMSAGHCGQGNTNATFRLYTAAATQMTEQFSCEYLVHTFADMDLNLFWCSPNADGEHPGDKYGYIDFDIVVDWTTNNFDYTASRARLSLNDDIYSTWMNPITSIGGGWHAIYSEGMINNLGYTSWHTPNQGPGNLFEHLCGNGACSGGLNDGENCSPGACGLANCGTGTCVARPSWGVGAATNLWSMGGASGSSQLRQSTHRILIGPLSVGQVDGAGRSAVGIADHLWFGRTDPNLDCPTCCMSCITLQVNQPKLSSLGIATPAIYYGWVDANDDGLFDVQKDIEEIAGEHARDWYWLGFESYRRNVIWVKHLPASTVLDASDPITGQAYLNTMGLSNSGYIPVLSHEKLNLPADRYYRVSYTTYVTQKSSTQPVQVCLKGTETHCANANPPLNTWVTIVSRLWASPGAALHFQLPKDTVVQLVAVSLIEDGAVMDFDSHDKRYMWRNHNTGERGRIRPNGRNSGTEVDWAGVVFREPLQPWDDDWSLRNRQLVVDGGANYRVCFEHRNSTHAPLTGNIQGRVRMLNEFGEIGGTNILFTSNATWQQTCIPWVYVPTDDNNLQFGVRAWEAGTSGAYLVDNIQIQRDAPTPVYVDWHNTSVREEGTPAYPYSSVEEGIGAVATGGTVIITGGTYPENIKSRKSAVLTGSAGLVRIGD